MRVLVTNDDGIASEGLHVLAAALAGAGHDVLVVAPDGDRSGASAAIGTIYADRHLDAPRVELPNDPAIEAYALDGPPGLCVIAARLGAFGAPPEVVVSGINPGLNTGRATLHSGTVGAVLTAQNFGFSGLAVSIDPSQPWHWATAARLAVEVLPRLLDAPRRTALNLNVPGLPYDEVRGIRWARLAPFGAVRAAVNGGGGDGKLQFELRATGAESPPDTDTAIVAGGYAALTTIVGIAEAWPAELHDTPALTDGVVPGAPLDAVHAIPDASSPRWLHRPQGPPPDGDPVS